MENRDGPDALAHLGSREAKYGFAYDPSVPEAVPNAHADQDYFVKFNGPEFTSLCPKTGSRISPIYISCIPDKRIGESRS